MVTRSRNQLKRHVAIEVRRGQFHLAVLDVSADGSKPKVTARSFPFETPSHAPHSESVIQELCIALRKLVGEERLSGARTTLVLNADYCVTRIVTGPNDQVRRELAKLEERSHFYLALGAGPKALATSFDQIDARHQHALCSVANRRLLDALLETAADAGLLLERIEPSMVALSRAVGHEGRDQNEPVLILNLGEAEIELGISYRGQLLLESPTGGRAAPGAVSQVVLAHLKRLRRYCQRQYGHDGQKLRRLILFGTEEAVSKARKDFGDQQDLEIETVTPREIEPNWNFDDSHVGLELGAVLGACLQVTAEEQLARAPNFMERIRSESHEPVWVTMRRAARPVLAALIVWFAALGFRTHANFQCDTLGDQLEAIEPQTAEAWQYLVRSQVLEVEVAHLRIARENATGLAWDDVLRTIAHCLPNEIWLERLSFENDGAVNIAGSGYGESRVYEFLRWLEEAPPLAQVSLGGIRALDGPTDSLVNFDVECKLAVHTDPDGGTFHAD